MLRGGWAKGNDERRLKDIHSCFLTLDVYEYFAFIVLLEAQGMKNTV